jgi:hypothetical protein
MRKRISAIFRNEQWQVTKFALASRRSDAPCRYEIDAERLLATENYDGRELYDWPVYVAQKPWVKAELFFEAFAAALDAHQGQYEGKVDPTLLQASLNEARRRAFHRHS